MENDKVPIDEFVREGLQTNRVMSVISRWRVEAKLLENIIVSNFREMGIFFVDSKQKQTAMNHIIHLLRYSNDISNAKAKAEREEALRRKSRPVDV